MVLLVFGGGQASEPSNVNAQHYQQDRQNQQEHAVAHREPFNQPFLEWKRLRPPERSEPQPIMGEPVPSQRNLWHHGGTGFPESLVHVWSIGPKGIDQFGTSLKTDVPDHAPANAKRNP